MGTWLVTIENEFNGKVDHEHYQVHGNDIYSAITEATYYIDRSFDAEDGYNKAIIAVELIR